MITLRAVRMAMKPGDRFGRWTVIRVDTCKAFCRCDCGTERLLRNWHLRSGESTSCGCYRREMDKRTYRVNDNAFADAEHSPLAAYYVGLIMADGCVMRPGPRCAILAISLAGDDGIQVRRLAKFLDFQGEVTIFQPNNGLNAAPQTRISVSSLKICNDLERYGVVERKSLIADPKLLLDSVEFWTGMIDGDGCVNWLPNGKKRRVASIGLVGSHGCVEGFAKFIERRTGIAASVFPGRRIWSVRYSGWYAVEVITLIYGSAPFALPRKLKMAQELLAEYDSRPKNDHPDGRCGSRRGHALKTITHNGETKTVREWSEATGIPINLIKSRMSNEFPPELIFSPSPLKQWDRRTAFVPHDPNTGRFLRGRVASHS
jgi:hypothetical protein